MRPRISCILTIILTSILLTGCGAANRTPSKGSRCAISFISEETWDLTVTIDDGAGYPMKSVKAEKYYAKRKIKESPKNTVWLSCKEHRIRVEKDGQILYDKEMFMTTSGHIVIKISNCYDKSRPVTGP